MSHALGRRILRREESLASASASAVGLRALKELLDQLTLFLAYQVEVLIERVLANCLGGQVQILELVKLGLSLRRHGPRHNRRSVLNGRRLNRPSYADRPGRGAGWPGRLEETARRFDRLRARHRRSAGQQHGQWRSHRVIVAVSLPVR